MTNAENRKIDINFCENNKKNFKIAKKTAKTDAVSYKLRTFALVFSLVGSSFLVRQAIAQAGTINFRATADKEKTFEKEKVETAK